MKKYLVLSVFILTASVIFYSCDDLIYSPKEEHFVNVDVPHTTMSINLDNAKDTVNLSGAVDLRYTVDTRGKRFSKIAIYIDSTLVATTDDQKHYFYIATGSYSDGPHKLFLQLWAFSGTGSLADKIGAEFIVSTSLWNVYIDNRQWTGPISMYNATAKNGTLELSWQKYTYHNFVNYEIYRAQLDGSGTPGMYYKIATITDPEKTWCTDNDYVGGPGVSYKVVVNATNRSITSNSISYYDSAVQICSVTPLDEQTFEIKW